MLEKVNREYLLKQEREKVLNVNKREENIAEKLWGILIEHRKN